MAAAQITEKKESLTAEGEAGEQVLYFGQEDNGYIGLCVTCDGHTKKEEIDLISQYMVSLRERCGISFYVLQQENRNSASSDRMKMDLTDCSLDGLKDSGNTVNDS